MDRRNYGCRITTDVTIKGNRAVIMENRLLRLTILTDRGTDLVELLYKPEDMDFMWRSPVGIHKKSEFFSSTGNSLGNYLDHNSGGWQEILPNGGGECFYKGACLGMHGEISNVPWQYAVVKDEETEICVRFSITTLRSPFRLIKDITLKADESVIYFKEELTNLAKEPMKLMWGHHPTVGQPFLEEHCRIFTNAQSGFTLDQEDFTTQRLPKGSVFHWPVAAGKEGDVDLSKIPGSDHKTADMVYLKDFPRDAWYEVYHPVRQLSYGMEWDGRLFPYLWMWLVCKGANGYPWYGRTYNLALEPWTSYSGTGLTGAIENNSAMEMKPDQVIKTEFCFRISKKERSNEQE